MHSAISFNVSLVKKEGQMALALIRPPFLLFVVFLLDLLLLTVFQLEFDGAQLNGLRHGTVCVTLVRIALIQYLGRE